MTNGDKIRKMTDDELVKVLNCNQCVYSDFPEKCECEPSDCEYGISAWLKQEVDDAEAKP